MDDLTGEDWALIVEALEYSKQAKANYRDYPSAEFRKMQVDRVDAVLAKIRGTRKRTDIP